VLLQLGVERVLPDSVRSRFWWLYPSATDGVRRWMTAVRGIIEIPYKPETRSCDPCLVKIIYQVGCGLLGQTYSFVGCLLDRSGTPGPGCGRTGCGAGRTTPPAPRPSPTFGGGLTIAVAALVVASATLRMTAGSNRTRAAAIRNSPRIPTRGSPRHHHTGARTSRRAHNRASTRRDSAPGTSHGLGSRHWSRRPASDRTLPSPHT
jgi:hypothetical protein